MTKYIRTQENIGSKIKDEIVMVNVPQGKYYALNNVATSIWDIIETPHSLEEICQLLMSEYEIDQETCKTEVESFIQKLLKNQVVKEING